MLLRQVVQARLAHQPRETVDFGAARAALGGLAVPAHGQVLRLGLLDLQDGVENDHALLSFELIRDALAAGTITTNAAPPKKSPAENFAGLEGSRLRILSQSHANTGANAITKNGCTN